jgi:trans-2,3-dihydro-3-hydroxyanthranilate isomerase
VAKRAELPLELDWDGAGPGERYFVVDVFTDTALEGNQVAIVADGRSYSADLMQRVAREMNFSETVFVLPAEGEGDVRVRIFTPTDELPFAGHPVLGCAFVTGEALGCDVVRLETGLGVIPISLEREGGRIAFGRMEQMVPEWHEYERVAELLAALGVERSELPVEAYPNGPLHVYVALESEEAVTAVRPDFGALSGLGPIAANCFAGSGRRWETRVFLPALGMLEDPATGSAAGPLAIHLARHGRIGFGEQIEIRQGAEIGRPSVLYARADGAGDRIERVEVGGSAVIVARGELRLPG